MLLINKPNKILVYEETLPMLLWTLAIVLNAWLGWIMSKKGFYSYSWQKMEEAYNYGRLQ